ncbi:MAG: 5-formyltetrahydrofolate cyclo-ligase [Alphaproteobacteria bacterium]
MSDNMTAKKDVLRAEALRARGLLSLSSGEDELFRKLFFGNLKPKEGQIIAAYWPKGREFDTQSVIDECLERGLKIALPVVQKDDRILKFALWDQSIDLIKGEYGILHPVLDESTEFVSPDIFLVPLLAFDRRGYRLGFGGGYYDTTLAFYQGEKEISTVGVAYAQQACLFNLPTENHDIRMDWIITQQNAHKYV